VKVKFFYEIISLSATLQVTVIERTSLNVSACSLTIFMSWLTHGGTAFGVRRPKAQQRKGLSDFEKTFVN